MKNKPKVLICNHCKSIWIECEKCPDCHHKTMSQTHDSNFDIAKNKRTAAIWWWYKLNISDKIELVKKHESFLFSERNPAGLTGREIEAIFTKEFKEN